MDKESYEFQSNFYAKSDLRVKLPEMTVKRRLLANSA